MKCPACKEPDLVMSERQGVEIDYCPQCRGVWLDRGELDKIIERSGEPAPVRSHEHSGQPRGYEHSRGHESPHGDKREHSHGHKKKRDSFLSDLFDF